MIDSKKDFPIYYDGSGHVEFSDEITAGMESKPNEATFNTEEWKRFISANPFGMDAK